MKMFEQYPLIKYWFDRHKGDWFFIRDIFIKVGLVEYVRDNPTILQNYVLRADERIDALAFKLYGNADLHWTILLVNDILDPRDWAMSQREFNEFVSMKYLNPDQTLYTMRNGDYAQLESYQFMVTQNPFGTIDSDPDPSLTDPSTYDSISCLEHETILNDKRKIVKAIKKEFITPFLVDFERKIKTLEGK
jgi:hypothetical protein